MRGFVGTGRRLAVTAVLAAGVTLTGCSSFVGGVSGGASAPSPTASASTVPSPRPSSPTTVSPTTSPSPTTTRTASPVTSPPTTVVSPTGPTASPGTLAPVPTLTLAPTGTPVPVPPAGQTSKKGVSTWYFDRVEQSLDDVGASWYYTWAAGPDRVTAPADVEFVPMIWGAGSVTPPNLATAGRNGATLLGFNEPDLAGQANMSVEQALELWPQLAATGQRLGAPAVASGGADPGGWLDRFMAGAAQRGYRVDFIPLHWYGSDFDPIRATQHLRSYIQAVHDRYGLPIWLTEYSLMDFSGPEVRVPSPQGQADFVTASTEMLESLPFVERYAWFALPAVGDSRTGLYGADGTPTPAGQAYRDAG